MNTPGSPHIGRVSIRSCKALVAQIVVGLGVSLPQFPKCVYVHSCTRRHTFVEAIVSLRCNFSGATYLSGVSFELESLRDITRLAGL